MNEKQKSIEIKSVRERILLQELFGNQSKISNIIYTPYDGNDEYDMTFSQSNNNQVKNIIVEAKVRNYKMSFPTWMIEKKKYNNLMEFKDSYHKILYINFFSCGSVAIWDLKTLAEPNWVKINHQANDYSNSRYIEKEEQDLNIKDCIQVLYNKFNVVDALDKAEIKWLEYKNENN